MPILLGACEISHVKNFDSQRQRSQITFFIIINHPKILNDLSIGGGIYLNGLIYQLKGNGAMDKSLLKIQNIANKNLDPVDFAKSTIKAFDCCLDSY